MNIMGNKVGSENTNASQRVASLLRQLKASPSEIRLALKQIEAEGKTTSPKLSVGVRNNIASVGKHVKATQVALKKILDSGEEIPGSTWKEIEAELAKIAPRHYRENLEGVEYTSRTRKGSSAEAVISGEEQTERRGRGRPKGSKNKSKVEAIAEQPEQTEQRRRGRPVGSKNKPKVEAVAEVEQNEQPEQTAPRRRGRPAGSKNRPKVEAVAAPVEQTEQKRRGRPVGSKNKSKGQTEAVAETPRGNGNGHSTDMRGNRPSYREWKAQQEADKVAA
jgi:hypothetical protein